MTNFVIVLKNEKEIYSYSESEEQDVGQFVINNTSFASSQATTISQWEKQTSGTEFYLPTSFINNLSSTEETTTVENPDNHLHFSEHNPALLIDQKPTTHRAELDDPTFVYETTTTESNHPTFTNLLKTFNLVQSHYFNITTDDDADDTSTETKFKPHAERQPSFENLEQYYEPSPSIFNEDSDRNQILMKPYIFESNI